MYTREGNGVGLRIGSWSGVRLHFWDPENRSRIRIQFVWYD